MKICSACRKTLPLSDFGKDKHNKKDGLCYKCKACKNAYYRTKGSEYYKKRNNTSNCLKPEKTKHKDGTFKKLAVDHNHTTGKIRGLLCQNCNRGIGLLCENVIYLENAIRYLKDNDE